MAKISALTELAAGAVAADDVVPVVDVSGSATKKVQVQNLKHYRVYVALLSQSGTDAPVATVLENSLGGTVVWTYSDVGQYIGTLAGAFVANKTFVTPRFETDIAEGRTFRCRRTGDDTIEVSVYNSDPAGIDGVLGNPVPLPLKICVYP